MKADADMKEIMTNCQSGNHNIQSLVTKMSKLYNSMNEEDFTDSFIFCLKKFLIVHKREPQVNRGLDFISKFTASLKIEPDNKKRSRKPATKRAKAVSEDEEDEDEEDEMHPFLQTLFDFLIKHHDVDSKAVRFRSCQLINMLLCDLGEGAQIDGILFDKIYDTMLVRVRDLCPLVRTQAVLALRRLQEPENPECPVIEAYLSLLAQDQNSDVRRAILNSIALTVKTLKPILDKTRDVNELVRRLAFKIIAEKVHIKAMTIVLRVSVIKRGLNDHSEIVKETCINVLVKAWLRTTDDSVIRLLDCLDCQNYLEECTMLVKALLRKSDPALLLSEFDELDERHCIPLEKLTKENTLYWRLLCEHFQSLGAEEEEQLEKLLPSCMVFVDYLKSILLRMKGERDIFEATKNGFILQQILIIIGVLDVSSDEAGRKAVLEVIQKILLDEHTSEEVVKHVLNQFFRLHANNEACLMKVAEIISDILQPAFSEENERIDDEKIRKFKIKIAELDVELMHLEDVLEDSITKQDFTKAAEVKETMKDLDRKKRLLEKEMTGPAEDEEEDEGGESQEAKSAQSSQLKNDPDTLLRCLTIISELLGKPRFNKLLPSLLSIMDMLITPAIMNKVPQVRNLAIKCFGLCCLRSPEKICQYLSVFVQAIRVDTEEIKITALKTIFNFLHLYGFPIFGSNPPTDNLPRDPNTPRREGDGDDSLDMFSGEEGRGAGDARGRNGDDDEDAGTQMLNLLTGHLDSESSAIRTVCVEGLSKLLLASRLNSPSLLSRLILIWYNPMTEEDTRLRHCLGSFFPSFAYSSRSNQEMVSESFLPTLKTLLGAPASSPLSQVKAISVAELMVHLSNSRHRMSKIDRASKIADGLGGLLDKCPHDDIAVVLSNEILTDVDNADGVDVYVKSLLMLELTPTDINLHKSLLVLAEKMMEEVKWKNSSKLLVKFSKNIEEILTNLREAQLDMSQLDTTIIMNEEEDGTKEHDKDEEELISTVTSNNSESSTNATTMKEKKTTTKRKSTSITGKPKTKSKFTSADSLAKNMEKSMTISKLASDDSSDAFEAPPKRRSLARKAKDAAIAKQRNNKRKRDVLSENDEDDIDDDDEIGKKGKEGGEGVAQNDSKDDGEDVYDDGEVESSTDEQGLF